MTISARFSLASAAYIPTLLGLAFWLIELIMLGVAVEYESIALDMGTSGDVNLTY